MQMRSARGIDRVLAVDVGVGCPEHDLAASAVRLVWYL